MPTTLTSPVVLQSMNQATLDSWGLQIRRTTDGSLAVDLDQSGLSAILTMRDANGAPIETRGLSRNLNQLPTPIRNAVRDLHNLIVTALRNVGQLPAGTDTADLT